MSKTTDIMGRIFDVMKEKETFTLDEVIEKIGAQLVSTHTTVEEYLRRLEGLGIIREVERNKWKRVRLEEVPEDTTQAEQNAEVWIYEREAIKKLIKFLRELQEELKDLAEMGIGSFSSPYYEGISDALATIEGALFDLLRKEDWGEIKNNIRNDLSLLPEEAYPPDYDKDESER